MVVVPAASLVFTASGQFRFSSSEYGSFFIPEVLTTIVAGIYGSFLVRKWGMRGFYRVGLVFNILAMALISASQLALGSHQAAYIFIIFGMAFVGAAFGFTLPAINVYATNFFPNNSASASSC